MTVTIFGGDLRTGLIRVRNIPAISGSCTTRLGAAGTINAGVKLRLRIPGTDVVLGLYDLLLPGKSFIGWEEDGVVQNAGPLWNTTWSIDSRTLSLAAAGLRSYWQFRYVLPALLAGELPIGRDTRFLPEDGLHLRTIAKRLVQQAQAWTNGSVPVVFEDDIAGDAQRTYLGHELHVVDEKLRQISQVIGGPDIMFNPRYTSDARTHIEWVMETGDPELTSVTPHKWDASRLPSPTVRGASVQRDAAVLTTDNYQIGATDDDEIEDAPPLMARATDDYLTGLEYPILESSDDRTSVTTPSVLEGYADQAVLTGRQYAETWAFDAVKSATPRIGEVRVGDKAILTTGNDPALGTADHELRVLEVTSTLGSGFAKITCAPKRVVV